jgi:hypothetical protein
MTDEQNKKAKKTRRAGQIVKRGEDRYLIRVFLGRGADGKRLYHNHTFHGTKKNAQTWLNGRVAPTRYGRANRAKHNAVQ